MVAAVVAVAETTLSLVGVVTGVAPVGVEDAAGLSELLRTVTASSVVTEEYQDSAELEATDCVSSWGPPPPADGDGGGSFVPDPPRQFEVPPSSIPPPDSSQEDRPELEPPPRDGWTVPRFLE